MDHLTLRALLEILGIQMRQSMGKLFKMHDDIQEQYLDTNL